MALVAQVLVGGALAAGGANTINCWIERDRDQVMRRTARPPPPVRRRSRPKRALVFGLVLEAAAFALLWSTVNLLSACLAVGAMLFYVFVYTIWLKPRSTQNIVIGGAAGAVPALVGWAAVTGELAAAGVGACSRSCSSGRRRTSGRWRCGTATTTPPPASRCSRW